MPSTVSSATTPNTQPTRQDMVSTALARLGDTAPGHAYQTLDWMSLQMDNFSNVLTLKGEAFRTDPDVARFLEKPHVPEYVKKATPHVLERLGFLADSQVGSSAGPEPTHSIPDGTNDEVAESAYYALLLDGDKRASKFKWTLKKFGDSLPTGITLYSVLSDPTLMDFDSEAALGNGHPLVRAFKNNPATPPSAKANINHAVFKVASLINPS